MARLTRFALPVALVGTLVVPSPARPADAGARFRFVDVAEDVGMYQQSRTWGSAWTDYDHDGDPDVFVSRHWRTPRMFVHRGDSYARLRRQSDLQGTQMDRHQCAWGEANHDGEPDLYCVQGADKGEGSGPNQLLINEDGNLVDRTDRYGVANVLGRGRTVNWLDYDSDGDLDLFVGNAYRGGVPNVLYRRSEKGFVRADTGLEQHLDTISSSWADWDHDGDPDLLVVQHYPFRPVAYVNRGGKFFPVSIRHVTGRFWYAAAWGDYDGDGWTDLHLVGKKRSLILRNVKGKFRPKHRLNLAQGRMSAWFDADNDGDLDAIVLQGARGEYPAAGSVNRTEFLIVNRGGTFAKIEIPSLRGPRTGNGEAVSIADHNRDGRLDIFITNGVHHWSGPNQLMQNESQAGNWAGVDLMGRDANPDGLGGRVIVGAGRLIYRREITDSVNFRAQSEVGYVHLGLGDATSATVNVKWPDGTLDCFTLAAGTILTVHQGTLPCA